MDGTLRMTVDGRTVAMSPADAAGYVRGLDRQFDDHEQTKVALRLKMGAALLEVRPQYPHGAWGEFVSLTGVDRRRVASAMQLAACLATSDGKPDSEKLIARGLLTQTEAEEFVRHGGHLPSSISLRQAEIAAGVRRAKPAPARDLGDEPDGGDDDERQWAGEEEMESLPGMGPGGDGAINSKGGAAVVSHGLVDQIARAAVGLQPELRPELRLVPERAGRIGDLAAARRPDAAGQLTLVGDFAQVESLMVAAQMRGGDVQRRASEAAARFRRELSEILEAA